MPYDVFISHSSVDKPVADAAVAVLERSRIRCWVAPRDIIPGADWGASIIQGIRGSRLMLVVFSSHANSSDQVKREVERAVHQGIPIIPLRIENILPTGSMEFFLSTPHWLDALSSPMEAHLEQLARTVSLLLYGVEQVPAQVTQQQPVWTAPAPDPYQTAASFPATGTFPTGSSYPTGSSFPAPGAVPQWTPPVTTATITAPYATATNPPLPPWLIAVVAGGIIALGGALYIARTYASSGFSLMPDAGPKMTSVAFFESGLGQVLKPRRVYSSRFANVGTRYINFEITLQFPDSKEENKVVLESKWFKPDGTTETKQDQLLVMSPGTTSGSWTNGWGNKEGGYFHAGTYTVDFFIGDKKIGSGKFDVYDGDAPPSGYIQSLDATVGAIYFYESANGRLPKEQRRYQNQFNHNFTRYINWELNLWFPKPASHTPFTIHEVWHKPDGSLEKDLDFPTYLEPAWDHSFHSSDGWGSSTPGGWQVGTYHVDFYVDKRKIASTSFEMQ